MQIFLQNPNMRYSDSMFFKKIGTLLTLYQQRTGQISGRDSLAIWLAAIASDPDVSRIVKLGRGKEKEALVSLQKLRLQDPTQNLYQS